MELTTHQCVTLHEDGDMVILGDVQGHADLVTRSYAQTWMQPAEGWRVEYIKSDWRTPLTFGEPTETLVDEYIDIVQPVRCVIGGYLIEYACSQKAKMWIVNDPVYKLTIGLRGQPEWIRSS